jgi:glycosyltransferase involved in cell wall biosynthesis
LIKVLHIVQGSNYSSGQTNAYSIARLADQSSIQIYLASLPYSLLHNSSNKHKFKFYPIILPKLLRQKHLKKVSLLIKEIQPDIIHSHDGTSGFYSRIYKKHNPGIKTIHSFHNFNLPYYESAILKNTAKTIQQYLIQFTDKFIFSCEQDSLQAFELKSAKPGKSAIIPKGIDISLYANAKKNHGLLYVLGLDDKNFLAGTVTDFEVSKNLKILIHAAYFVKQKFPFIKFLIVGDGKRMKYYSNYIRESGLTNTVFLTGAVEKIQDYYSLFDVYVNTSTRPGIPYTILEAMASRNAIVSSHLQSYETIIHDNENALTFDPGNVDDLFSKLQILYENPEMRQKLSQNALIDATQFDEYEMVKKTENIYREVVG